MEKFKTGLGLIRDFFLIATCAVILQAIPKHMDHIDSTREYQDMQIDFQEMRVRYEQENKE